MLLQFGFLYGGGFRGSDNLDSSSGPLKSTDNDVNERLDKIDKINKHKQRQKRHELIRQKFLEANREFRKALDLDAEHNEGPFVDPLDEFEHQQIENEGDELAEEETREGGTKKRASSKLVNHLLGIAQKYYEKSVSCMPLEPETLPPRTSEPNDRQQPRNTKKAERYWKALAALIICDAVYEHQKQSLSFAGDVTPVSLRRPARVSSSPQLRPMLRYSYNSPRSALAPGTSAASF